MSDKEWRDYLKNLTKRAKRESTKMYITITEEDVADAKKAGVGYHSYSFAVKRLMPEGMYLRYCSKALSNAGDYAVGRYMVYIHRLPTPEEQAESIRNRGGQ